MTASIREQKREAVTSFNQLAADITAATPPIEADRQPYGEPGPFYNLSAGRRLSSSPFHSLVRATSEGLPYLALLRTGNVVEVPSSINTSNRTNPVKGLDSNRPVTPREIMWSKPGGDVLFKATKTNPNLARDPQSEATVSIITFSLPGLEIFRPDVEPAKIPAYTIEQLVCARGLFDQIIATHDSRVAEEAIIVKNGR